jgi:DNA-binding PadR family transcriptional regulator
LNRLEEKGLIASYLADPTHERGGRAKRYYMLTRTGKIELEEIRTIQQKMWEGIPKKI